MTTMQRERALARAEFRAARRRRALTLLPGAAVILWALADLVASRFARLSDVQGGFFRHVADHIQPVAWTLAAVLVPYLVALKPRPKRTGAVIALFTGPVLSPLLFGAGGWRLWQIAALAGLVLWIESQDQPRVRRRPVAAEPLLVEEEGVEPPLMVPPPVSSSEDPLQAISGASLHSRSSS